MLSLSFRRCCTAPLSVLFTLTVFSIMLSKAHSQEAVRYVASLDELQRATSDGVRVIVVTQHINFGASNTTASPGSPLQLQDSTEAILGSCDRPPVRMMHLSAPLRPGECVLTVEDQFLFLPRPHSPSTARWLDHLYIKVIPEGTETGDVAASAVIEHEGGWLYMSNCTLDGSSRNLHAVDVSSAYRSTPTKLYTDDCTFTHFTNSGATAVALGENTAAALHHSYMIHNTFKLPEPEIEGSHNAALQDPPIGAAVVAAQHSTLLIHDCNFQNNILEASEGRNALSMSRSLPRDSNIELVSVSVATEATVYANPERKVLDYSVMKSRDAMHWSLMADYTISADDFEDIWAPITAALKAQKTQTEPFQTLPPEQNEPSEKSSGPSKHVVTSLAALFSGIMLTALLGTAFALHRWRKSGRKSKQAHRESSAHFHRPLVNGTSSRHSEPANSDSAATQSHHIHAWLVSHTLPSNTPRPPPSGASHTSTKSPTSPTITPSTPPVHIHAVQIPKTSVIPPQRTSNCDVVVATQSKGGDDFRQTANQIPAKILTASHAVVSQNNIDVPGFKESTGAFGTTCSTKQTTQKTFKSAQNILESQSMSLTSVGGTTSYSAGGDNQGKALEGCLAQMVSTGAPFLMQYVLEGQLRVRKGSRGAVQFARSRLTGEEVAIKFFLDAIAFRCEEAAVSQPKVRKCMDALITVEPGEKGQVGRMVGDSLPSCIVYELGAPLDQWCARAHPNTSAVVSVLCDVAQRVADLHAAGFTHRDLKASNVLWSPRAQCWTLVDFGCAAPHGYKVNLSDCAVYVPPEALSLIEAKHTSRIITVDASVDVWALGVMALEILSGNLSAAAFAPVDTQKTHACDTRASRSSVKNTHVHGEFAPSNTVSVCDATHEDHASYVTQQLYDQLSCLNLLKGMPKKLGASVACAMSVLRMRIAACIAREPDQRPSITSLLHSLQSARDELQAAHACAVPSDSTSPNKSYAPSYDSLLCPSEAEPRRNEPRRSKKSSEPSEHPQRPSLVGKSNNSVATGGITPTYMPASPEITQTDDSAFDSQTPSMHAQHALHTRQTSSPGIANHPTIAPELLAARLKATGNNNATPERDACMGKVSRGAREQTPTLKGTEGMLPLEVNTDGSAADESPDALNGAHAAHYKFALKWANFGMSSSVSDTSSTRSDRSSISGTQQKIRSKRPPLQTVTSGIPTSEICPLSEYRTAAEALVECMSKNPSKPSNKPLPLTSSKALFDTFGAYRHEAHAHSPFSETTITPTLSPRAAKERAQTRHSTGVDEQSQGILMVTTDTPPGGLTPQNPGSPSGHVTDIDSMHHELNGEEQISPPSSFEAIEADDNAENSSPPDSFLGISNALTVSRQRSNASRQDAARTPDKVAAESGGVLRPSAFKSAAQTETSAVVSTQYTGVTINMDENELSDVSSVQLRRLNLAESSAGYTPSFGVRHGLGNTASTPCLTSNVTPDGAAM